jgi:hypothetical protein
MNIGFYGHSTVSWRDENSLIDILKKNIEIQTKENCKIVNIGVPQGSEERILYDLKKTKEIDIAIIFHSHTPRYIFLPNCNRDIAINSIPEDKSKIFWSELIEKQNSNITKEDFTNEFFSYGGIKEVFKTEENFINAMKILKTYFRDKEGILYKNRYESAKLMIDSWCLSKCPKVIHVDSRQYSMPWFKYQSGIENYDINEICFKNSGNLGNAISKEGNILIANELFKILKENNYI